MNVLVIGTGYVGLTTGVGLSAIGHNVICIDNNIEKINQLNLGIIPIHEPKLNELIEHNKKNILFTTNLSEYIDNADVIFLAVGTPQKLDGSVDLSFLHAAFDEIIASISKNIILIIKSTVPVNTNENLSKIASEKSIYRIDIISNPEFLREGFSIDDFFNPARIIIGSQFDATIIIEDLYAAFIKKNIPIIYTDPQTAELSKYASNAFLATKIAFINEIANLCEYYGGNIDQISHIMGLDERIGSKFLKVSPGFGGSCFPKDLLGLKHSFDSAAIDGQIVDSVIKSNQDRVNSVAKKIDIILQAVKSNITILGASFKAGTDDIRESPAIKIIGDLASMGYIINLHDPAALNNARGVFADSINYFDNIESAVNSSTAIVILTEWDEFRDFDYESIAKLVANKVIIDFRNILDKDKLKDWQYHSLGNI